MLKDHGRSLVGVVRENILACSVSSEKLSVTNATRRVIWLKYVIVSLHQGEQNLLRARKPQARVANLTSVAVEYEASDCPDIYQLNFIRSEK